MVLITNSEGMTRDSTREQATIKGITWVLNRVSIVEDFLTTINDIIGIVLTVVSSSNLKLSYQQQVFMHLLSPSCQLPQIQTT